MVAHTAPRLVALSVSAAETTASITPIARARRPTSWMLARLQAETGACHAAIDHAVFAPFERPTVATYRHFLARVFGFDAPLGTRLLATPGLPADLVVPRIRSSYIAADLLALDLTGVEAAMLRNRHDIPAFATADEALGWLYAWERLILRHDDIRTRLHARIPGLLECAGKYLALTTWGTRFSWHELGQMLDRAAHNEVGAGRIVTGAKAGFASLQAWLDATPWDGF